MKTQQTTKSPKKTKKKTKKYYFTKEHEDAVIKYCKTNCVRVRTELYVKYLEPALFGIGDLFEKNILLLDHVGGEVTPLAILCDELVFKS